MKVLVTGANGYIGQRLIVALLEQGHEVLAMVRDPSRFDQQKFEKPVELIQADLLEDIQVPEDIDIAYYLVHSMSSHKQNLCSFESKAAANFVAAIDQSNCKQIIYLGGISNADDLSRHLRSRMQVEEVLSKAKAPLTVLRAAIIIGSGSASFEIIRDLVEKLPVMLTPKWLDTRCQPIAIANVIQYLTGVIMKQESFGKVFDIGGPDVLTYKQMLAGYAKERGLKRLMIPTPFFSITLSSFWLFFITSTNFSLASSLVESLTNEVICQRHGIKEIVPVELYSYQVALQRALYVVSQDRIISSWKDSFVAGKIKKMDQFFEQEVPRYGVQIDRREIEFDRDIEEVKANIWSIGGERGWYFMDWAWELRGLIDKVFGGVGLRRGRRDASKLKPGDALDFWRVLSVEEKRLVLYAEMKLPGEAWLEFELRELGNGKNLLIQQASYRPHGLWGRLYWYMLLPVHFFLFGGMAKRITEY